MNLRDDNSSLIADDRQVAVNGLDVLDAHTVAGNVFVDHAPRTSHSQVAALSSNNTGASDSRADEFGNFRVDGEFGSLIVGTDGNYRYIRTAKQTGSSDLFTYKLIDRNHHDPDAILTIRFVEDAGDFLTLPDGVGPDDLHLVGGDLLVALPDGSQLVFVDGAMFKFVLMADGTQILTAVGPLQSSGGNFLVEVGEISASDGIGPPMLLGDLLAPTELVIDEPVRVEELPPVFRKDDEFGIIIITPGDPAASVNEAGLPARASEPAGSDSTSNTESVAGTIQFISGDPTFSISINGTPITAVGQTISGTFGVLMITSFAETSIGFVYTLADNTAGDSTVDLFSVAVTDGDSDIATATLSIEIVDDLPVIQPDTSTTPAGLDPASGNVITDAEGDGGGDAVGADGAVVTAAASVNVPASPDLDPGPNFQIAGQYGVLTLSQDGSYSYIRNPGTPGEVSDVFSYTLTDGDGDSSTTTFSIFVGDASPIAGANALVQLDDDVLAGGNAGGTGDDIDAANLTGTLSGEGGDIPLTWAFQLTGAPAGFNYVSNGAGGVLIQQGGITVLTVTLNPANGAYTVTQNAPIDHAAGGDENNQGFTLAYTVTDVDGGSAAGTFAIDVDDDTPVASAATTQPVLVVDESNLAVNASASFAGVFTTAFGADGSAANIAYTLGINAGSTGLVDTASGEAVSLVLNGSVVEGRTAVSNLLVFSVSVDALGTVTLDQVRAVVHPNADDPGEPISLAADNLVTLTTTLTDGDGDTATATADIGQNLSFEDDGPVASSDSDTIPGGSFDPASGNVITDAEGDGGGDAVGADGAVVTAVASVNVPASPDLDPGPDFQIAGQYGVLTLSQDGSYSYIRNLGSPGEVSDVFTYTLTDGDGDSSTATVTFSIGDASPIAGANALVQLDDDVLAGGNAGGTGDDIDAANLTGTLSGEGGDIPLTWAFQLTGAPAGFNYVSNGAGGVLIQQGGITVLTVTLNPANGAYTVTQNAPIDHAAGGDENNQGFTLAYTVTDVDGGSAAGTFAIDVDDDTPVASAATTQPVLVVDESNLAVNASASFAGVFTTAFGADGSAANIAYTLGINAGSTGLVDTASGEAVSLVLNGSVVEGRTAVSNLLVFSVSVDALGTVTLDQVRAVVHPNADDPGEPISLAADNLVTLTTTLTDGDGDTATATADIGQNLSFEDDGPVVTAATTQPLLVVDESDLVTNASANFANVFTAAFGADGSAGNIAYALGIHAGSTGLIDTASGEAVSLVLNGSVVEGRTAIGNLLVFSVSVDALGNVTLNQLRAVVHPTANPDEPISLAADNLVTLTATLTDGDGDTATATANIGQNLSFEDDGPVVTAATTQPLLVVDESNLAANASASFAGVFTPAFGPDGASATSSVTYALGIHAGSSGLIDTATGNAVVLALEGSQVVGRAGAGGAIVFTVSVNVAGTVTLNQVRAVVHPNAANPDEPISLAADNLVTLTATVTDGDGDQASATANIGQNLSFEDAGPVVTAAATQPMLVVDESDLVTNASASFANVFTPAFGADGSAGNIAYTLGVNAGSSGLIDTATGNAVVLALEGSQVVGRAGAGGAIVFTVSVNVAGTVTLDQVRAVVHPNAANPDEPISLAADNLVTLTATLTDGDGDTATATANIGQNLSFEDDGPVVTAAASQPVLVVDETNLAVNASASFAGVFTTAFGADGSAGNIAYTLGINAGSTGLVDTASGEAIVLSIESGRTVVLSLVTGEPLSLEGGQVVGRAGADGPIVFTVSVDADGTVTLNQVRAVVHPNAANPDEPISLAADNLVTLTATVTDSDGDQASATADIGQNLSFEDAGPVVTAATTQPMLVVDETNLAANASASFAGVFTAAFGADGPAAAGPIVFALGVNAGSSGLIDTATGNAVVLALEGSQVVGRAGAGGAIVFTVSVNVAGTVTLDQLRAVVHPTANPDEPISLAADNLVTLTATLTDGDGDTATATANIGQNLSFEDDGPVVTAATTQPLLVVDESNLAANASASFAGVFTPAFGADGSAGNIAYTLGINAGSSGLIDTATGNAVVLALEGGQVVGRAGAGGAIVFTVSVNVAGTVTLDQVRAVVHPNAANPDEPISLAADNLVTLTATVTDGDGDQASATASIGQNLSFEDDGPVVTAATTQPMLVVDESDLVTNASASFANVFTAAFGVDGPAAAGPIVFALGINAGSSGLIDTATGNAVVLALEGSQVVGRAGAGGAIVFTVSVNVAGTVTLDQVRAVVHPNAANPDEPISLAADNLVTLTATLTDGDGDTATATANIGQNLSFEDAAPVAVGDVGAIPAGSFDPASGNVITDAEGDGGGDAVGADGAVVTAVASVNVPASPDLDPGPNFQIAGQYGVLTLSQDGSASYIRNPGSPGEVSDVFTYTLTDGDGDSSTATVTFSIGDASPIAGANALVQLDDDVLAGGNAGGTGDDIDAANLTGTLSGEGGDIPLTWAFQLTGAPAGFNYVSNGAGGVLIQQGGITVLTVTLNPANGAYTVTQNAPIDHAAGGDENNQGFTLAYTVTDVDGGSAAGTFAIDVDDDTPVASAATTQPVLVVDETNLAVNASASFAGVFTTAFGADGSAANIAYTLGINAGSTGLVDTASGEAVSLVLNGSVVEGRTAVSNLLVFSVSVDALGTVTLDQVRAVVHPNADDPGEPISLAADNLVTLTTTLTDGDGDTATATADIGQNLSFEDDGPVAVGDVGAIPAGSFDPASGNVITDAEGDGGGDAVGADGAVVTAVASVNVPASPDLDPGPDFQIAGQYGVLTLSQDGSASYIRNPGSPGEVSDVFTYTLTDGDGDSSTATVTFSIGDASPIAGANALVQLDDDVLAGGNAGGTGDDIDAANLTGTLSGEGGDIPLTWAFQLTGAPAGFNYVSNGAGGVLIQQGGITVLTVTLNPANGAYTVTQNAPIDHAAGGDENNQGFTLAYTVTDVDGGSAAGTFAIDVDDDTPVASAATTQPVLVVDESNLAANASASFAGVFTPAFGADGSAGNIAYTLGVNAGSSGLVDTATGNAVVLALEGSQVVGRAGAGGAIVFTVSVNVAGTVTLNQVRAVVHPNAANPDEPISLAADNLVTLTATVTDGDGDQASATANIGQNLSFEDAGPVVTAAATQPMLVVDESDLVTNASASFANVFTPAFGADGSAGNIAYTLGVNAGSSGLIDTATGNAVVLALEGSQVVGRAGAGGAIVFTVSVNVAGTVTLDQVRAVVHPNAANPDEPISLAADNLVTLTATLTDGDGDTATATANIGQNLSFEDAAPVAVGDVGAIPAGSFDPASGNVITDAEGDGGGDAVGADGAVVTAVASVNVPASPDLDPGPNFQIAGQYGVLTLSQDGSASYIRNPGSPGEVSDVFTYTLTDGDGDSSTATVTFSIGDASPIAGANALVQLDDDVLAGGNAGGTGDDIDAANLTGTLSGEGGDIPLTWAFQLTGAPAGFNYVSNGAGGVLIQQGGITVLTVTLNPANGAYTVTQNAPIDHAAGGDENNQGFTLAYTVTDVDGGSAAGTFAIDVDDDTPVASAATTQPVLVVDETNLAVNASASFAGVFTTAFGADGSAANIAYTLGINAGSTGLVDTASGEAVSLVLNGSVVEGRTAVSNLLVFSVSVDALGTVTLDQVRAVVHPNADDPGEPISLAADNLVTLTTTLTDGDGDTATATADIGQNLSFEDDGPVASSDSDTIPGGSFDPASGNVITDAEGDGGGDAVGADGAVVTAVASVNVPASPDLDPGPDFQIAGQYGVLTLSQDGSYSYIRNPGTPGEVSDVFSYTLTDGDGDSSTTTLTIFIDDATPVVGANALVQLDDDVLAGGNAGGTGDDIDAANLTGTLSGEGGDIPLTWAFQLTGAPAGFNYVSNGAGGVLIQQGGITVLTVTLNPANGAYTVTQNAPIDHAAGGDENNQGFTLAYTVTDVDGGSAAGTFAIDVDDDTPVASAATTQPVLVVDETNLAVNASASFAGVFTTAFGADGSAANIAYTLGINAGSTGLVDTASGEAIVLSIESGRTVVLSLVTGEPLSLEGGQVVGRAGADGPIVFTVSVDADGTVTLNQVRAVVHPNAANPDEPISLAADNLVTLTATLTDGDGDTATATASIGQNLSFEDAGPVVTAATTQPMLVVDETNLAANASASFAGVFTAAFGADGPAAAGPIVFALGVNAGSSGLIDTATGNAVVLALEGSQVVGRAGAGGAIVFTVSVNVAGTVTLDQLRAVVHPTANPDEPISLAADNLVTLTATLTDGDGDTATATANIGQNLSFEDDGPVVTAATTQPVLVVDESNLAANASASFAGVFTPAFGADGSAGNIAYTLGINAGSSGLVDTATGNAVVLALEGGQVVGRAGAGGAIVFTVSVNVAGTVTLDQVRAVVHPNAANPDEPISLAADNLVTLTATVTDGDGDQASATASIGQNLSFEDDGPVVTAATTQPMLVVDESDLVTNASASFANVFTAAFGVDGPAAAGPIVFALGINAGSSGLIDTATGNAVVLALEGSQVVGRAGAGGAIVFTVSVNVAGTVTLDQVRAVVHPNAANPDEPISLAADNLVTLTATLTDGDGDTATATANIGQNLSFEDAAPVAVGDVGAIPAGSFDPASGNVITDAEGDGGGDAVGADGAVVTAVASVNVPASPDLDPGPNFQIAGQYGVLTLSQDGSASYIRNPGSPGEVSDVFTYTLTDGDGDSSTATVTFSIGDASPIAGANALVQLDDDVLAGGNAGGTGDDIDAANLTGTLSGEGGDIPLTWAFQLTGAPAGFNYVSNGAGGVLIQQGGITVLTVTLNPANGAYTVTQNAPIDHAAGGDENNQGFTLAYTVTDVDGGSAAGTFAIDVDDDTPVASAATTQPVLVVDETNLAVNASASFAGVFTTAFGADGSAANIAYTLGINAGSTGLVDTASGEAVSLVLNGSVVEGRTAVSNLLVFSVSVDALGTVTLDQVRAVVHPNADDPGEPISLAADNLVTLTTTLTDGDGDTATATADIGQNLSFEDDGPVASSDSDTIPGGSFDPASGNVITDAEGDGGGDAVGADGAVVTAVASVNVPASPDLDPGPDFQIAGQYGVLTLSQDGSYSYIRNPGTPGEVSDVFSYTLTDGDGDSSTTTFSIFVGDASPIAGANALVQLDDDVLAGGNAGGTGDDIDARSGGNAGGTGDDIDAANLTGTLSGEGGDIPLTWAFQLTGAPAGFNYVSNGAGGVLIQQGGITVLTVTLNPANGAYTVTQNAPIDHAAGGDENNQGFTLAYTVTDVDGGSAAGTFAIDVDDDTPVASAATTQPVLVVDESNLAANASASFAGVFTPAFGADGSAGNIAYTLGINAGSSGLIDTATGNAVVLALEGSQVVGRAGAGGAIVFTVSVNVAGTVTLDQVRAVVHPNAANPDEPISLAADNLVTLTATLTDGDGDTATATANIGQNLSFEDAAPVAVGDVGAIPADSFDPASGNVITDAEGDGGGDAVGADGAVVTAVASVNVPASPDLDPGPDFQIAGQYGVLTLSQDGSASYIRNPGTPGEVSDVFSYTLTDGDGDSSTATVTFSIGDASPIAGANALVQLGDDALAGGNAGGTGDDIDAANLTGTLSGEGGDIPLTWAFQLTGAPAGFNYVSNGAGGVLIQQGGITVLTVTLNPANGAYTVTQNAPIDHAAGGDENNQGFTLAYTVTDVDGGSAAGTFAIDVDDDTPVASAATTQPVLVVDETNLAVNASASFAGVFTTAFGADGSAANIAYTLGINAGSTGLVDTASGEAVSLVLNGSVVEGRTAVSNLLVFSVSVDALGTVTLDQVRAVVHPNADDPGEPISLATDNLVTLTTTLTDGDGDTDAATANIGANLRFTDDGPAPANDTDTITAGPASGNVITDAEGDGGGDAVGADGAVVTAVASVNIPSSIDTDPGPNFLITGQYGQLTLNQDGSYSYARFVGTPAGVTDAFTYFLTDADGDRASASLTVSLLVDLTAPPEGLFSIPSRQTVGMNQIVMDNGDLIKIDPVGAARPFGSLSLYLAETSLGGVGLENDVDAIHVLDDGRIVFSTANGELRTAAGTIRPNSALGQIDAFIYNPATNSSTIATGLPGLVFPTAFASSEKDKLQDLHVLSDGSVIFSLDGSGTLGGVSFQGNDLIHWDGVTATMVFQASTQLVGARLYTGVFGSQTQIGTVDSSIGNEITSLHVLSFAADGITPNRFVISTGSNIVTSTFGQTVLDKTNLIEIFRDDAGDYWVNSVPYFDSGDNNPADDGEEIDAVWLGDFESLPPPPDIAPPEGLFSIPSRQSVGMNQLVADNGDLVRIDPVGALRPFSSLSVYLAETNLGGPGQDNNVDAIHVLDDGRIVFSTSNGELRTAAGTIRPDAALGQIDAFIYNPATNSSTIATGLPGLVFPTAFASSEKDKLEDLHVLRDGSVIFSLDGSGTLGGLSFQGNDLIRWDGVTATMVFQASTQLVGARLYTGVFGTQTLVGTVRADIDNEITSLHVLSFAADGITPTHFVISTGGDIRNAANGQTVLDKTQLIEVFRDDSGVYWVNSKAYFDSGDNSPADNGEEIDAVWLGDLDAFLPASETFDADIASRPVGGQTRSAPGMLIPTVYGAELAKMLAAEIDSLTAHSVAGISLSSDGIGYTAARGYVQGVDTNSFTRALGSTGALADDPFKLAASIAGAGAITGAVAAAALAAVGPTADHDSDASGARVSDSAGQISTTMAHILASDPAPTILGTDQYEGRLADAKELRLVQAIQPETSDNNHSLIGSETVETAVPLGHLQYTVLASAAIQPNASSIVTQPGIAIPSAAVLAEAFQHSAAGDLAHAQNLSHVLADVLSDGGDGPSIDALLLALLPGPGNGEGSMGLDSLAGGDLTHGTWGMGSMIPVLHVDLLAEAANHVDAVATA